VIAEAVGVGAVKYSILKVARNTATAFDFDTSLSLMVIQGYLVYTYVRAKSILRESVEGISDEDLHVLKMRRSFSLLGGYLDTMRW
jgi:arginyl-tRNA synthetase